MDVLRGDDRKFPESVFNLLNPKADPRRGERLLCIRSETIVVVPHSA
jgi:hypothetical protein